MLSLPVSCDDYLNIRPTCEVPPTGSKERVFWGRGAHTYDASCHIEGVRLAVARSPQRCVEQSASFEYGASLQEVTIDMLTVPPISTGSTGIIVTTIGAIVSTNRGDISIGMARVARHDGVLSSWAMREHPLVVSTAAERTRFRHRMATRHNAPEARRSSGYGRNGASICFEIIAPHLFQERFPRKRYPTILHQTGQQVEFFLRQSVFPHYMEPVDVMSMGNLTGGGSENRAGC